MVRTDKDAVGCGLDEAAARKLPLDSLPRMICAGTNLCSEENSGRAEASDVILTLDMPRMPTRSRKLFNNPRFVRDE